MELVTVQGNLNEPRCQRDVLETVVIPHFDNHALPTRPLFMDNNAKPHRKCAFLLDFLQRNIINYHSLASMGHYGLMSMSKMYQNCQQHCIRNPTVGPGHELVLCVGGGYNRY